MPFYVKVPKDRVGVIVGEKGKVKRAIERQAGVKLAIDSKTGDVTIQEKEDTDPAMALAAQDTVKAIARGLAPERAYSLLKEDYYLHLFDIRDYVGKDSKHVAMHIATPVSRTPCWVWERIIHFFVLSAACRGGS